MAAIESHRTHPLRLLPYFFSSLLAGGLRSVHSVDEADCARVSEAVVLAEEEREAVSLRIRPSPRLPGSLKLFDDRTGQHHCRWGGSMEAALWGMEACHLYTAVSFILSSSPFPSPPTSLSLPLPSPLLFLWRCCFTPSPRPLQALKEKLYSAVGLPVLRPCKQGEVAIRE